MERPIGSRSVPAATVSFAEKATVYTEEQFQAFLRWEASLLISLPPGMAAGFVLKRRSRRRKLEAWDRLRLLQPTLSPEIEEQRYATAWKGLRWREVTGVILVISTVLCFVSAFVLRSIPESPILLQLSLPIFLLGVGFGIWNLFFRCPRCRNRHSMNRASREKQRCTYCGLRRGATFEEGFAELRENG
jgi:hypothetical protein